MIRDDPGEMPPYHWRRAPVFGLPRTGAGRHAVVISSHVAPDFATMPGQDRMLAIWAEPLLDALVEAGFRTTLLVMGGVGDAAEAPLAHHLRRRRIGLALAAGDDPVARCMAVDEALSVLAADIVHAPERGGLLATALSRRAAGVAHLDTAFMLHARGPTLFQMEEQARFIGDVTPLLLDDLERQAMRLADRVVCCNPEVAGWLARGFGDKRATVECRMVAPLVWQLPPVPAAEPTELVFPLPLGSEAGLEFAVAALARAASRRPLPLPVTFLGQPDLVTIGNAASVLAGLAPPPPAKGVLAEGALGKPEPRLDWRVLIAETPQRAMEYLAQPGRVALLTSRRATPPELLAMCGQAGIPVLATDNAAAREAASRWRGIHVLARAERGFGAVLARLPALPAESVADETPALPALELFDEDAHARLALSLLSEPNGAELTLLTEARPSLVAQLREQKLQHFGITLLVPPEVRAQALAGVKLMPAGPGGMAAALAACDTRYAVLCGDATRLAPDALGALLRAARSSGALAIAAWDDRSRPIGGGSDAALLRPGGTVGHLVLLDLPALRARGGASLSAAGTPGFAAALAAESGGVMMLALQLASAPQPPATPDLPGPNLLPARLSGATALALHLSALPTMEEGFAGLGETQRAMATANRDSTHYLKLVGRLLDMLGLDEAAAAVWAARLARDVDDGETWMRHSELALAADGRLPDVPGLASFVKRHGVGALGGLPEAVATQAQDMLQVGRADQAWQLLAEASPALSDASTYIQALARGYARLARGGRRVALPPLPPPAHAALRSALETYAMTLPALDEEEPA